MKSYRITAFGARGKKQLDETFTAGTDEEAIAIGEKILQEKNLLRQTHRLTTSSGKLLLFHS